MWANNSVTCGKKKKKQPNEFIFFYWASGELTERNKVNSLKKSAVLVKYTI